MRTLVIIFTFLILSNNFNLDAKLNREFDNYLDEIKKNNDIETLVTYENESFILIIGNIFGDKNSLVIYKNKQIEVYDTLPYMVTNCFKNINNSIYLILETKFSTFCYSEIYYHIYKLDTNEIQIIYQDLKELNNFQIDSFCEKDSNVYNEFEIYLKNEKLILRKNSIINDSISSQIYILND